METFYTSKYDRIFRSIFADDNNYHLLEAFISKYINKVSSKALNKEILK